MSYQGRVFLTAQTQTGDEEPGKVLACLENRSEKITETLDAFENNLWRQVEGEDGALLKFFPAQRRGNGRVSSTGSQGIGSGCIAAYTVLGRINGYNLSTMRWTRGDGDQIWIARSQLLPNSSLKPF